MSLELPADLPRDLDILARQEALLQFESFNADSAWDLGCRLKSMCEAQRLAVLIEIRLVGQTVFLYAMPGTTPENADWARRKHNAVDLLQRSSYALSLEMQAKGSTLAQRLGLPERDFVAAGGCFPIRVRGTGFVGTVTVSGLPQRADHRLVSAAVAQMLGVDLAEHGLDLP